MGFFSSKPQSTKKAVKGKKAKKLKNDAPPGWAIYDKRSGKKLADGFTSRSQALICQKARYPGGWVKAG